jgi:Fe2+ transport system protein FeoA
LNQELKVVSIVGGYNTRKRLADMGLVPEAKITVLNNNGPFILAIKGSRVAVGLGIARKIVVTPAEIYNSEKKNSTNLSTDKGEEDE